MKSNASQYYLLNHAQYRKQGLGCQNKKDGLWRLQFFDRTTLGKEKYCVWGEKNYDNYFLNTRFGI